MAVILPLYSLTLNSSTGRAQTNRRTDATKCIISIALRSIKMVTVLTHVLYHPILYIITLYFYGHIILRTVFVGYIQKCFEVVKFSGFSLSRTGGACSAEGCNVQALSSQVLSFNFKPKSVCTLFYQKTPAVYLIYHVPIALIFESGSSKPHTFTFYHVQHSK